MGYRVGEFAGPYEVLQLVGRGTFGEVFVARDQRRPSHRIALKTVACDQFAGDAAERARSGALAEAKLLIQLRHPNVVRCEEVQWHAERSTVWLALEFMDGGDVQSLIGRHQEAGGPSFGPFEPHFVRRVLAAVGSALQYVHFENVLHRDVKPANILLSQRARRIKLGDFGIAKLMEATGRAHTVVGTPYYLAPEIVSGQAYGAAADAWALGVCLFELAALQRPFDANNPLALMRRICEESPMPLPPGTVADISEAILGLLQRDPEERLRITDALAISDAVATLAALSTSSFTNSTQHDEKMVGTPHELQHDATWENSFTAAAQSNELSPVSAVSMATSESDCSSNSCQAEIVASLWGHHTLEQTLGPACPKSGAEVDRADLLVDGMRQGTDVLTHARAALASEVDDPEGLQAALRALDQEMVDIGSPLFETFEALRSEVQFRLEAMRADATTLLQKLLEQPPPQASVSTVAIAPCCSPTSPGWCLLNPNVQGSAALAPHVEETVMTVISDDVANAGVGALETAIELATTLGVNTDIVEERAASNRGLLSLRVTYGNSVRCFLLPIGVSFAALVEEVMARFRLGTPSASKMIEAPPFRLFWSEGSDVRKLHDQASWDACLCHCGLHGKPGRMHLRLEMPFVITGTRVPSHLPGQGTGGNHAVKACGALAARPKHAERQAGRSRASLQRAGRQIVPVTGLPARRTQARRNCSAGNVASGIPTAALRYEARGPEYQGKPRFVN